MWMAIFKAPSQCRSQQNGMWQLKHWPNASILYNQGSYKTPIWFGWSSIWRCNYSPQLTGGHFNRLYRVCPVICWLCSQTISACLFWHWNIKTEWAAAMFGMFHLNKNVCALFWNLLVCVVFPNFLNLLDDDICLFSKLENNFKEELQSRIGTCIHPLMSPMWTEQYYTSFSLPVRIS